MRLTLRAKLLIVVAIAALALVVVIIASSLIAEGVQRQIGEIERRYVPRVALKPRLEAQFERLRRALQDAVAADDAEMLAASRSMKDAFLSDLASARGALEPDQVAATAAAIDDYYAAAEDVSRRLIAGETGEKLVDSMKAMQAKQGKAAELLDTTTRFDARELGEAFADAHRREVVAGRVRLAVSIACLALVLLLSVWLSRDVVRSLAELTAGLRRFGTGDFREPVAVTSRDELAEVAAQANQMAESLRRLSADRDRSDWVKGAQAGLAQELQGELEPDEAAARASRFLAQYLGAPVAALYAVEEERELHLLGQHAAAGARATVARGEGLLGQAALRPDIVTVDDVPADHVQVRTGLGESRPRALALVPLVSGDKVTGVLEVGLMKPLDDLGREMLLATRQTVAIAIEVARARSATRELLSETVRLAQRLTRQEEDLRATNDELQAQQEELRQTNDELEHKARELATVSAYKSQFLANMSHELRTPLNSMLLLSSLLTENQGKNLTDKQIEYCRTIHSAGKDLLHLINQVLDLAKIEAGKQEVRLAPARLEDLALRARRVFEPLARHKGLALTVEVAPGLPESIVTDGRRVEQIINNLVGNAIKFTARGEVALRIGRPDPNTRLRRPDLTAERALALVVSDTGPGIEPHNLGRIFAPFEQADATTSRRFGGTGLGLSIARELAGLLGGELQVESTVGKGSTFTCYLPTERPVAAAKSPPPVKVVEPPRDLLLMIEDDPVFAELFGEVIRAQGLRLLVAPDARTGLALAREHAPAGIILDVKLPDADGWKILEELRTDPATAAIPVHFVSAVDAPDQATALGAVGYLTKPATRADLVRVVEDLVPRRRERALKVLVVEPDGAGGSVVDQLAGEPFAVARVTGAQAALDLLERERFDCLVLDLAVPDMDGLELLRRIEERQGRDMPSVVVCSARPLSKAEVGRLEAYAESVVLREGPFSERLLDEIRLFARRLKEGLAPRRRMLTSPTHPADLRLDGRKVLVVDDDMRTLYALSATLRARGVEVLVADTGKAALAALEQSSEVEAVLMDVMMPEMDGLEAMRRIRALPRFARLPIIALTAKAMVGDPEKCIEAGASDYLAKPIDADRLVAMLGALIPRARREVPVGASSPAGIS